MIKNIIAVVMFIAILTVGILDQVNIKNSFTELIEKTDEVQICLEREDYEKAKELSHQALIWWNKKRDLLELTCPHNEVKDLATLVAQLDGYVNTDDKDNAIATCMAVKADAYTRYNILAYKIKNVF